MERGFVGREKALKKLARLLEEGRRLVSVCGGEGIGKSRFVREYSERYVSHFPGGLYITNLAAAETHEDVLRSLGMALDIEPAGMSEEEFSMLVGELFSARGRALWVADNYEERDEASVAALESWLELAPDLQVIVTARHPLRIKSETRLRLGALRLPVGGDVTFETLAENEAVKLFTLRAKSIASNFSITENNVAIVRKIVDTLDGVPLAIELAAARVSAFSPAEILERLPANVRLWTKSTPPTPAQPSRPRRKSKARVQGGVSADSRKPEGEKSHEEGDAPGSLSRAIDWAWGLLDDAEKDALAQATVFEGPFTEEAAQEVLLVSADKPSQAKSVVKLLKSLNAKSLIEAGRDEHKIVRFSMNTAVRRFAKTQLSDFDGNRVRNRHANYFLERARHLSANIDKHGGVQRRRLLELDTDNLLALTRHALATEPRTTLSVTRALEALLALEPVLSTRGPFGIHLALLDAALAPARPLGLDERLRAQVLESRGRVRRARGMLEGSLQDLGEALSIALALSDSELEGRARANIGTHHLLLGEFGEAERCYKRAIALLQESGSRLLEGRALSFFGRLYERRSQLHSALEAFDSALEIHRDVGDKRFEAITEMYKGALLLSTGKTVEATKVLVNARAGHRSVGNQRYEGVTLKELGRAELLRKKIGDARHSTTESLQILRRCLDRRNEAEARILSAEICLAENDPNGAREELERAHMLSKNAGDAALSLLSLVAGAALDAQLGALDSANRSLKRVKELREGIQHADTLYAAELMALVVQDRADYAVRGTAILDRTADLEPLQKSPPSLQLAHRLLRANRFESQ